MPFLAGKKGEGNVRKRKKDGNEGEMRGVSLAFCLARWFERKRITVEKVTPTPKTVLAVTRSDAAADPVRCRA
jgi:hypothetical protein